MSLQSKDDPAGHPGADRPGTDWGSVGRIALRVVTALAVLYAVMVGLGLLLTKVLDDDRPLSEEDAANRELAGERTGMLNDVTKVLGELGNTITIIVLMVVVATVLRLTLHRWRESVFVVLAVSAQALVFMLTQLVLTRQRPDVPRLDSSPPTSSFPSGHTGAAIALYGATALVILWHVRRPALRFALVALFALIPVLVAYSRLYRGMHFPSDIVGSVVNALGCLWISTRNVMSRGVSAVTGAAASGPPSAEAAGRARAAR